MAGRKTDFNTEDIMGSLLGRRETPAQEKRTEPEPLPDIEDRRPTEKKKENKEIKVPVSFSMTRKMADDLKRIAYVDRITCSEIICELVSGYIRDHQSSLREYDRITKR